MKRHTTLILSIASLLFLFASCGEKTKPESKKVIEVTQNITSATTWETGSIYVIKKYDFYVDAALTIQPGVIIKFTSTGANLSVGNGGSIIANGSAGKPIVFTSFQDDSNGGDSNENGSSSAQAGAWGMIDVAGQNAIFSHCHFLYGGLGDGITLNYSSGATGKVENCVFQYNLGGKSGNFYTGALHANGADATFSVKNTKFKDNGLPLTINADIDVDDSNTFTNNKYQGIFVTGAVNEVTNWGETECAFVYTGQNFQVKNGKKLNMSTGVVIKFVRPDAELFLYNGTDNLSDNYADASQVNYTSFKDDSMGGDSNGDGSISLPSANDWSGVYIDNQKGYAEWDNIHFDSHAAV